MTPEHKYIRDNIHLLDKYDLLPIARRINTEKLLSTYNVSSSGYNRLFKCCIESFNFKDIEKKLNNFIADNFTDPGEFFIFNAMRYDLSAVKYENDNITYCPLKLYDGFSIRELLKIIVVYLQKKLDFSDRNNELELTKTVSTLDSLYKRTSAGAYSIYYKLKSDGTCSFDVTDKRDPNVFHVDFTTYKNGKVKIADSNLFNFIKKYSKLYFKVCFQIQDF